jgi:small subunit ribosomal protein S5
MAFQQDKRKPRKKESEDGMDSRVLKVRRVSRMYHGGRRMRFSAFVVVGDKQGKIGVASAKAQDVASAQEKASKKARRNILVANLKGNTIPHRVEFKFKSSKVLLMPAAPGTGIVAGATVKAVAELAGIKDLLTKVVGSTNPINTATAAVKALGSLKRFGKLAAVEVKPETVVEAQDDK